MYDNYVEALETGTVEALQAYARNLSERIIPRGVETNEVVGIVLLLRDVLARSLFAKYHGDFDMLNRVLDAYEPAANRIAITVAVGFVQERERIIREQQEAIRELSTPVLQVRERLLILPIIGVIDPQRARQLTEQLLRGIRDQPRQGGGHRHHGRARRWTRAWPTTSCRRWRRRGSSGATVIVTGLSPEIAQTLVNIGVDLGKMNTVGDLQGGIEEAERLLGYTVVARARSSGAPPPEERRRAMQVPILKQGSYLIATHPVRPDRRRSRAAARIARRAGRRYRSRGVIVDVTALDVMDSFATPHPPRHRLR